MLTPQRSSMRIIRGAAVAMFLLMLLPSLSVASMQEESTAQGRESTIQVSELFISPNNLVSNETSQNVYGAVIGMLMENMGSILINSLNCGITAQQPLMFQTGNCPSPAAVHPVNWLGTPRFLLTVESQFLAQTPDSCSPTLTEIRSPLAIQMASQLTACPILPKTHGTDSLTSKTKMVL